ncbi:MAG TPA: M12 family metallo-peptidase, partial [Pyrinomonadaceae bacterium]
MESSKTPRLPSQRTKSKIGWRLPLVSACVVALLVAVSLWPAGPVHARAERKQRSAPQGGAPPENVWRELDKDTLGRRAERALLPHAYRALSLDRAQLAELLSRAPLEFSNEAQAAAALVALPLPDGSFARFGVVESPIMEPELAARFPAIKTYRGQGLDDPTASTRFDWTPEGLHAIILSARGTFYVGPYARGDNATYLAYAHQDITAEAGALACAVTAAEQEQAIKSATTIAPAQARAHTPLVVSGATLRTYRLAVAATAEYTQTYGGGTTGGALSAITTTVNLVDAIYERDVAVRLVLVAGETSIIFTDTATDGYTSDSVGSLINENQTRLDAIIGAANYDIGHVFDGRTTAGGFFSFQGQAGIGVVCTANKGRGATIFRSVQPSNVIAYYIVAHEMGHQFGATHTFNAASSGTDCAVQRTASTAYEPGTGSTIMGYRFNCGTEDMRSSDTYFHGASLQQIVNYTTTGNGSGCPTQLATNNHPPNVSVGAQSYTIPANTPFALAAAGSDQDGDTLTYTWEEFDLGPAAPPDTDDGARPIFRSYLPSPAGATRSFPSLQYILNNANVPPTTTTCSSGSGTCLTGEALPTTTRTMNFRVTARDNRAGGGGLNSADTQVNVRADSGPFKVLTPAGGVVWAGNTLQPVTWNVANTTGAPVSCANVRILLSTDGGNTFPYGTNPTPNDGAENIVVPNVPTTQARVKVEAVGNIFFDISDANITVQGNQCDYALSKTSQAFERTGGTDSVTVTTTSNCGWAATSNADWITVTAGAAGQGSGTVTYTVSPNGGGARTGSLVIAGQTFTVTQAAGCSYVVTGPGAFPAGGGPATLTMTTGAGCAWTATSLVPWITITQGSGTGSGSIAINLAPNTGAARTGQILHTDDSFFNVAQAAADTVNVQFSAASFSASEGDARATVTVTRGGDTSGPAYVAYMTVDDPAAVPCNTFNGTAYARCDYATTVDTLAFAAGETSKTFSIPLIDDAYAEGAETAQLRLLNPAGAVLGAQTTATLTITDNDAPGAPNPIFT